MKPFLEDSDFTLYCGDVLDVLRELPTESIDCCITSPPYWGLRDYGTGTWAGGDPECPHEKSELRRGVNLASSPTSTRGGAKKAAVVEAIRYRNECAVCGAIRLDQQVGLEDTPEEYVEKLVAVFGEVRRILVPQGSLWLNLGDSYAGNRSYQVSDSKHKAHVFGGANAMSVPMGMKAKDLVGIPWMVAFALRADGWYLRSDIIWAKPNPMPESITDRPTKAHEYVFLLTKKPRYYFDQDAIREPAEWNRWGDQTTPKHYGTQTGAGWIKPKTKFELMNERRVSYPSGNTGGNSLEGHIKKTDSGLPGHPDGRNARSVWEIATQPYADAHFAVFPEELPRRAMLAGCPPGGTVLDPFMGSGTVAFVARAQERYSIGIELNSDYCALIARRMQQLSLFV